MNYRMMKLRINILIIFLIPFLFTEEKSLDNRTNKTSYLKHKILKENFNDTTFLHHPQYKKLVNDYKLELSKIRIMSFENDSIYKLELKLLKTKHDSLRINLFRKLAKK